MRRTRSLFLVFIILPNFVIAQIAKLVNEETSYETSLLKEIRYTLMKEGGSPISSISSTKQLLYGTTFVAEDIYQLKESSMATLEAINYQKDLGLELSANLRAPSSNFILDPNDGSPVQQYYVQLGWNVLHQGFAANRSKANAAKIEAQIYDLREHDSHKIVRFKDQYNFIIATFARSSISLLTRRLTNLDYLIEASEKRSFLQPDLLTEHLDFVRRKEEVERIVLGNEKFIAGIDSILSSDVHINVEELQMYDVDLATLKDSISTATNDRLIAALKGRQYELLHPWYENYTVKPYLRYGGVGRGLAPGPMAGNRAFDAGVQLRIPLKRAASQTRKYQREYSRLEEKKGEIAEATNWNEVLSLYSELSHILRQYRGMEVAHEKIKINLRNELIQSKFDQVNHTYTMMQTYDALVAVEFEMMELKKRTYIRLLQMDRYLANDSITNYLTEVEPFKKMDLQYIQTAWVQAKHLLDYPYNFISGYLLKNHVTELVVFASDEHQFREVEAMMKPDGIMLTFAQDEITLEPLAYTGHLILDYTLEEDLTREGMFKLLRKYGQVTLLVEPSEIERIISKNITPSVFILETSKSDELGDISSFVNGVPVQLQVNVSEFSSRYELMEFIKKIRRKVDPIAFVMNDLAGLIDLDKKNFE